MATGWPMKTTYANGDVYSASDVNDITGTINLLGSSVAYTAGKNKIINGDFGIWQRGTSVTGVSTETYSADRFTWVGDGSGGTRTFSRQTMGYGDISGYQYPYFFRFNQSVAGTGATYNYMAQRIESVTTLAGQTVTFSFWAKAGSATTLPAIYARQRFGSGGSAETSTTVASSISLTTSWQRFTYSFTVPSIAGKTVGTGSYLTMDVYHPINTTFTIDMFGWQLEAGSTATAFQTATGTIQGELAACQRYMEPLANGADATNELLGTLQAYSTTQAFGSLKFMVQKRGNPTLTISSGTAFRVRSTTASTLSTTALAAGTTTPREAVLTATVASGLSAGSATVLEVNSASAYIWAESEL